MTRLGRADLEEEMAKLRQTMAELEAILGRPRGMLNGVVKTELGEIRARFNSPRRAVITVDPGEMAAEDLIEDGELVITMTRAGLHKGGGRHPPTGPRAAARGGCGAPTCAKQTSWPR